MVHKALAFQRACRASAAFKYNAPNYEKAVRPFTRTSGIRSASSSKQSPSSSRRAITVTSDDGRYEWSELSTTEKAARTTQQSFNFLLVAAGAIGTATVSYFLYAELFAADSKTRQFNHAVDRVKADSRCRELLGPSNKIIAYGEPTTNKWARARPLAHTVEIDRFGITHLKMHFNVEGPDNKGVVNVHMTKSPQDTEMQYKLLSLHIPGHQVVYLENTDAKTAKRAVSKMFGVQWR